MEQMFHGFFISLKSSLQALLNRGNRLRTAPFIRKTLKLAFLKTGMV